MSSIELILLASSLSLDAVAVSIGAGTLRTMSPRKAAYIAGVFGLFHALMPLVGWAGGLALREPLMAYGNIIGFVLLMIVGVKMLKEGLESKDTDTIKDVLRTRTLLALALATSIDVLVVGISFSFVPVSLPLASLAFGIITFLACFAGVYVGKHARAILGTRLELCGAVVLFLIGFKVLLA